MLGCTQPERPPSVILVSLDTLRADRLGAYGNPDGLTPNLDRFAAESVVFTDVQSQASETLFSHGSLFTGRYPSELGRLSYSAALPEDVPTLPEVLALYGLKTGAAVGGIHLDAEYGFARGFETYESPTDEAGSLFHTLPPALAWLDTLAEEDPFFLFLHSYDTHSRYLKPPPFGLGFTPTGYDRLGATVARAKNGTGRILDGHLMIGVTLESVVDQDRIRLHEGGVWHPPHGWPNMRKQKLTEGDMAYLADVYDGAVAYADAWFGRAMAALEERGLLEDALIVVLSDHGEQLGEQGVFAHRYFLDDTSLSVPLIIRPPGGLEAGLRVESPVTLLDVAPTLYEHIGATPPAGIHGRSLLPALSGQPVEGHPIRFSEGMFRMISAHSDAGRLTFSGVGADSAFLPELLATSRLDGPAFEGTVSGEDAAALRDAMLAWRASMTPPQSSTAQVSPALLQELRDNGYWGDL